MYHGHGNRPSPKQSNHLEELDDDHRVPGIMLVDQEVTSESSNNLDLMDKDARFSEPVAKPDIASLSLGNGSPKTNEPGPPLPVLEGIGSFFKAGFSKTKNVAGSLVQINSEPNRRVGLDAHEGVENSQGVLDQVGKSFATFGGTIRDGVGHAAKNIPVPAAVTGARDDMMDVSRKAAGSSGICSKCSLLQIEACYEENQAGEVIKWVTPLSRALYHGDWCRMCFLLLTMLCRPEFDPLKHPEVAPYVQDELKGMSMRDWVARGWKFAEENWPFGQSSERHESATYVFGPSGDALWKLASNSRHRRTLFGVVETVRTGSPSALTSSRRPGYYQGLRDGKNATKMYPLGCSIELTMTTSRNKEYPGLAFVTLVGYGNRPGGEPQALSRFRLHAAHPRLRDNLQAAGPLTYGNVLDKNWIDLSITKWWLNECESRHGDRCSEHDWSIAIQKPGFLRVVDVIDVCLVEPPDAGNCRFVALSYVWGQVTTVQLRQDNIKSFREPHGLESHLDALPRTIVDAMEVVKALGERYLWVDTLCVLQDNSTEAREQVATMDRVYSSALLTIVAAQGNDAQAGLLGVRRTNLTSRDSSLPRDITQPSACIRDDAHIVAPFKCTHALARTAWDSRAWTYQEKILSKRLLIFCGQEVVWHCREMICREDMRTEDSGYTCEPLDWLSLKPQYFGLRTDEHWVDGSLEMDRHGRTRLVRSGTFAQYSRVIGEYTRRQLTYKTDIIRALEGLLHIFQLSFKSEFLYGMPKALFDVAILWRPVEKLKRREGFPSWSWAGWEGQIAYDSPWQITRDDSGQIRKASREAYGEEGIRPLLKWHFREGVSSELERLNGHGRGVPVDNGMPHEWEAHPQYSSSEVEEGILDEDFRILSETDMAGLVRCELPCLVFATSCVETFQLGAPVARTTENKPTRVSIVDTQAQWIGTMLLDGGGPEWITSERHLFVLLSEAQYFGVEDEKYDVAEYPNYLVMLVEYDVTSGAYRRLGLGRVWKTAWIIAQPVLKIITLA